MSTSSDASLCRLQSAAGRVERCPEERCPFWCDGRCLIAGLDADLGRDPVLAHLLLDLCSRLSNPNDWSPLKLIPQR